MGTNASNHAGEGFGAGFSREFGGGFGGGYDGGIDRHENHMFLTTEDLAAGHTILRWISID